MSRESKDLTKQLKALNENIDLLIKVTAISVGRDTIFKGKVRKEEKLEVLDGLKLPDEITALLIGSTAESVRTLRSQMKKARAPKIESDVEFRPDDLHRILTDPRMFPTSLDLITFVNEYLAPELYISTDQTRDQLVEKIIATFENRDRMKQALFIQALERLATDRALRDPQFMSFLEAWERHIGR